jgi:hypothetical protein
LFGWSPSFLKKFAVFTNFGTANKKGQAQQLTDMAVSEQKRTGTAIDGHGDFGKFFDCSGSLA